MVAGFGQSEPLTNRLKRLLEDYTDGFAIPKELVQNADDAGATEVRTKGFCLGLSAALEVDLERCFEEMIRKSL